MLKRTLLALVLLCGTSALAQGAVPCVNRYVTNTHTTQGQFDAMVDFTFNVGCGNFRHSTLLKKHNRGDVTGASREFGKWIYDARHHKLAALIRRRAQERARYLQAP